MSAAWTSGPWSLRGGRELHSCADASSGSAAFLDGLRPAQTPAVAATLAASWARDGKEAEVVLRRVGAQYEDDLNSKL